MSIVDIAKSVGKRKSKDGLHRNDFPDRESMDLPLDIFVEYLNRVANFINSKKEKR